MIIRTSNPRALPPGAHPSGETATSTAVSPEGNFIRPHERAVGSKLCDELGNHFADQSRVVFIEFGRSGIAVPCLFQSFHAQPDSQGGKHDHA